MPKNKKGGVARKAARAAQAAVKAAGGVDALARRVDNLAMKVASQHPGPVERAGRKMGGALGFAGIGGAVGRALGKLTGSGDYRFDGAVNSLMKPGSEAALLAPHITGFNDPLRKNTIRIRKVEFIKNIISSTSSGLFKNEMIRFNPGNPYFPWLSSSAALGYEKWRVLGAVVYLKTASSDYAASTSLGTWGVAIDYNSTDPPYNSKSEAEQSEGCQSAKVSVDIVAGIECASGVSASNVKYIRFEGQNAGLNYTQTDHCTIQVFSQGVQATNSYLGELWIAYDIELIAQEINGGPKGLGGWTYTCVGNGTASTTNYFGTSANTNNYVSGNIPITVSGGTIFLPTYVEGTYSVEYLVTYSPAAACTGPLISFTGQAQEVTIVADEANPGTTVLTPKVASNANTGTVAYSQAFVRFTTPSNSTVNTIVLSGGVLPAANQTQFQFRITQLPDSAVSGSTQQWIKSSNFVDFWSA